jgi:hypothetical protein
MRNVMTMVRHDYRAFVEARAVLRAIAARHLCNAKPVSARNYFGGAASCQLMALEKVCGAKKQDSNRVS